MSKKKPASIYTALRIPPELRQRAKMKASNEGRSLSNYIKFLIKRDLGIAEDEGEYGTTKRKK